MGEYELDAAVFETTRKDETDKNLPTRTLSFIPPGRDATESIHDDEDGDDVDYDDEEDLGEDESSKESESESGEETTRQSQKRAKTTKHTKPNESSAGGASFRERAPSTTTTATTLEKATTATTTTTEKADAGTAGETETSTNMVWCSLSKEALVLAEIVAVRTSTFHAAMERWELAGELDVDSNKDAIGKSKGCNEAVTSHYSSAVQ